MAMDGWQVLSAFTSAPGPGFSKVVRAISLLLSAIRRSAACLPNVQGVLSDTRTGRHNPFI
jgi:hypothetical protein